MPSSTTRNTCPAPAGTRPARPRGVKSQIKAQTVKKETMKMDAAPPIQQSEEMADEMEVAKESAVVAVVEETAAEAAKALLALSVLAPAAVADPVSAPTFTSEPAPAFEHTVVMVDVEVVARGLLGLQAARTKLNLEVGHSLSPPADAPAAVAVDRRPPSTATAADLEDKTIQSGLPTGWVRRVDAGRHRFYFIDTDSDLTTWEEPTDLPEGRETGGRETPLRVKFLKHLANRTLTDTLQAAALDAMKARSTTMASVDYRCSLFVFVSADFCSRLAFLLTRDQQQAARSHQKRVNRIKAIVFDAYPPAASAGRRTRRRPPPHLVAAVGGR